MSKHDASYEVLLYAWSGINELAQAFNNHVFALLLHLWVAKKLNNNTT